MINITPVQALNHKLPWEPEVFADCKSFLVNILCWKIFRYATVICITELYFVIFVVEQVIDVDIVNISLEVLYIYVGLFVITRVSSNGSIVILSIFIIDIIFILFVGLIFIGFFEPSMWENLGYR